ncbi:hypothetical protein J4434_07405 [Candidatus Woesearchaeota archaeon]|nr:hypothetical protein [Candidatus Woesearchaeota archaeon]
MFSDLKKDSESTKIPETIDNDLIFKLKAFYGFVFVMYVVLGILIVMG